MGKYPPKWVNSKYLRISGKIPKRPKDLTIEGVIFMKFGRLAKKIVFILGIIAFGGIFEVVAFAKGNNGRARHLHQEQTLKTRKGSRDSQDLDFNEASISGTRRTPMGTLIGQTKSNKDFDFVKIRMNWHPEMINSAKVLESSTR